MANLSLIKKLAGDSLVYGISGVISRFIAVFLVPVYTRIFTPSDYGAISLITTLFALLSILVVLGLDNSAARWFYEDDDENDRKTTLNTFLWSCFAVAVLFSFSIIVFRRFVAFEFLHEAKTFEPLLIAALNLPLTVFINFTANVLRIQKRAFAVSVFSISIVLLMISLNIVFVVLLDAGIIGVFYAQIFTSLVGTIWTFVLFKEIINPFFFDIKRWKEMFRFSLPLIPGSIAFWVINLSAVYFIQMFANSREVGLYQIGISVASVMALLTNGFQMAWGPFAFSIYKEPGAKETYAATLDFYIGVTCIFAVLITLFSREALLILATEEYVGAFWVAGILSFNHLVIGLGYLASIGTGIAKNNKAYGFASLFSAFLLVGLNLFIIPRYGKEGAAVVTVVSQIIIPVVVFWHSQILYPIPYNFKRAFLIFLLSLFIGFGTLILIQNTPLSFALQIFLKIFAFAVFLIFVFVSLDLKSNLQAFIAKSRLK